MTGDPKVQCPVCGVVGCTRIHATGPVADSQGDADRVAGWLGEGYATWSSRLANGSTAQYQLHPGRLHDIAPLLEWRPDREVAR